MTQLGLTDLDVFPISLGGNVFGWTADADESFAVLDAYAAAGGNFVDTSSSYTLQGGESETIVGDWMADRGNRDDIVLVTKVGGGKGELHNLRPDTIRRETEKSLERLKTDRIDVYYAHFDDPETPLEDSLRVFDELVKDGTVGHLAASNYEPDRLQAALEVQRDNGFAPFRVLQVQYNLVERSYEDGLAQVAERWQLAVCPFFALAMGFLTGKYRPGGPAVDSARAPRASAYLDNGGLQVLDALDDVAAAHDTTLAAVAIAWLRQQPGIAAPVASARTVSQLDDLLPAATLTLAPQEIERLSGRSA
jgi:aryl-alcohol dehydrogenase-like predicted oxidoreductase